MRARKEWLEWFRVDRDLPEHPKTLELARASGCSREEAVGRIVCFWAWVARHFPRGLMTESDMQSARDLGLGVDALIGAAFIERSNGDGWRIRNWHDFNGKALRERARKRRGDSSVLPRKPPTNSEPTGRDGTETVRNERKPPRGERRTAPLRVLPNLEITEKDEADMVARFGLSAHTVSILAERVRLEAPARGYKNGRSALINWCKIEIERNGTAPNPRAAIEEFIAGGNDAT